MSKDRKEQSVIIPTTIGDIRAKGLLHAIREIQQWSLAEIEGGDLPEEIITQPVFWNFAMLGASISLRNSIFTFLTLPFSIAVVSKVIPIFGTRNPSLFDVVTAFCLSTAPSLMTILLITLLFWDTFIGRVTRKAIYSLVAIGILFTKVTLTVAFFILYTIIAGTLLSPNSCTKIANFIYPIINNLIHTITLEDTLKFLEGMRYACIKAAWMFALLTALKIGIFTIGYLRARHKTKKFVRLYQKYFPDPERYSI